MSDTVASARVEYATGVTQGIRFVAVVVLEGSDVPVRCGHHHKDPVVAERCLRKLAYRHPTPTTSTTAGAQ